MNTDFRLACGFWHHPKTKKLVLRLGLESIRSLQILWSWVAQHRSDGNLAGLDRLDVELASDWQGPEGELVSTLIELRWLDESATGLTVHDWSVHNPWASKAEERGEAARLSRLARIKPKMVEELKANGKTGITAEEYTLYANDSNVQRPHNDRSTVSSTPAPAPSPTPAPAHNAKEGKDTSSSPAGSEGGGEPVSDPAPDPTQAKRPEKTPRDTPADFATFWQAYPRKVGKQDSLKAWTKLKGIRPDLQSIIAAIERLKASPDWLKDGGQFIPHPATWLNRGGWEDEVRECNGMPMGRPRATTVAQVALQTESDMARMVLDMQRQEREQCQAPKLLP